MKQPWLCLAAQAEIASSAKASTQPDTHRNFPAPRLTSSRDCFKFTTTLPASGQYTSVVSGTTSMCGCAWPGRRL